MQVLQNYLFQQFIGGMPGKDEWYFCKGLDYEMSQGAD